MLGKKSEGYKLTFQCARVSTVNSVVILEISISHYKIHLVQNIVFQSFMLSEEHQILG